MSALTGNLLIGSAEYPASAGSMRALNPKTNEEIAPDFAFGGEKEVTLAVHLAEDAFDSYQGLSLAKRALFLEKIAANLEQVKSELALRASLETGLEAPQLEAEAERAANQFRKFATLVKQGRFLQAAVDTTASSPADIRLRKVGIGPVVIFGASNFPISYSVAGGDTASALAAGCTVILKAHNAHPGASEIMARAIIKAVQESDLHEGVFSLVRGAGNAIGEALVLHPLVKAVTFTGSEAGGMALYRLAQSREEPIPVFAEMTSSNPSFVFPNALATRAAEIGTTFSKLMQYNVGQACLKPAIMLAIDSPAYQTLRAALIEPIEATPAKTMLTPGIYNAYHSNLERHQSLGATKIASGLPAASAWEGQAALLEIEGAQILKQPELLEEVFGPAALLVKLSSLEELFAVAKVFKGQLSAAMHIDPDDFADARALLPVLERRTGRVIINGFSIPQASGYAAIHGGPFPATTDSRFTSVGMSAIERFLRPVSYQGFPDELLPESLTQFNQSKVWRLIDGELTTH